MDDIKICCPKCTWEPNENSAWLCSCNYVWNTFDTGGRCPKCSKIWEITQCIGHEGGCSKWSPHLDWYTGLSGIVEKFKKEIAEDWLVKIT